MSHLTGFQNVTPGIYVSEVTVPSMIRVYQNIGRQRYISDLCREIIVGHSFTPQTKKDVARYLKERANRTVDYRKILEPDSFDLDLPLTCDQINAAVKDDDVLEGLLALQPSVLHHLSNGFSETLVESLELPQKSTHHAKKRRSIVSY